MQDPHLLLEVKDTGIGIPKAKLDQIFESFCQADDSTTRRYGGTGLGTTIARDLTRLMGGRIGVDSEVGRGCRFWVRLPLPREAMPAAAQEDDGPRLDGRRALVFENNATSRDLIMEICRNQGMECEPVLDIAHLSRMAGRTREVDLLIVADSPQPQDLDALLELFYRVLGADAPYLLLTYGARRADRQTDCVNCLNKPFLAEDLVRRVRQVLGADAQDSDSEPGFEEPVLPDPADGPRILVAEDNAIAGRVITALLEKSGCRATLVRDGEEALVRARAEPFAMAFIDLHMPKVDGFAFARAFRSGEKEGARLPIIALTASAAEEIRTQCLEAGMTDFLGKPVNQRELSEMVRRYLEAGGAT
jgi:two-component system sensor histidine kinase RpfC